MLCCSLLRIQSICQKIHLGMVFALTVEWFCYFFGLWLHYRCHHKGTGTFQTCCFLPCAESVAILKREEGERNGMTEDGKTWGNKQRKFFFCYSFGGTYIVFVPFLSGCSRKFLILHGVCIVFAFCLKSFTSLCPGISLSECHEVLTISEKH